MRKLLLCFVLLVLWGTEAGAIQPTSCHRGWLCPNGSECLKGRPAKSEALSGTLGDKIGWVSEVYQGGETDAEPTYCYFRAFRLEQPEAERLPLFWGPGGLKYDGPSGLGCVAVCENQLTSKPAAKPRLGSLKSGRNNPLSVQAPSWAPESGFSAIQEQLLRRQRPDTPIRVTERRVSVELKEPFNFMIVDFLSGELADGSIAYTVRNLGKQTVQVGWEVPENASMREANELQKLAEVMLEPGQETKVVVATRSADADKKSRVVERPSVVHLRFGGTKLDTVSTDFAPDNGTVRDN